MNRLLFLLLFLFLLGSITSPSQTFAVLGRDNKSVIQIEEKLKYMGYRVVAPSDTHDYSIELRVSGQYKVVTFKQTHKGYISITDQKSGGEIVRSKEYKSTPAAINGYNASYSITNKILKNELEAMIKTGLNKEYTRQK